jgi:hypothetical protein
MPLCCLRFAFVSVPKMTQIIEEEKASLAGTTQETVYWRLAEEAKGC